MNVLRGAAQCDHRQVTPAMLECDVDGKRVAGLARDQRLRTRALRTSRPAPAWLNARSAIGRLAAEVDFIRRATSQRHMRPMFVEPIDETRDLTAKVSTPRGNRNPSSKLCFKRAEEPFDVGDIILPFL